MTMMLLDLDEALLAEAMVALGAATKEDTINEALRRVRGEARLRRQRALADLQSAGDSGDFDFRRVGELDD